MTKKSYFTIILFIAFCISSCGSFRHIPYFKDLKNNYNEEIKNNAVIVLQPQDLIGIYVTSLNAEASAIFNTNLNRVNGNNFENNPTNPIYGYLIDYDGNIQLPTIGKVKIGGLNMEEANIEILKHISLTLKQATVTLRLLNFKVTILGDVQRPGVYSISNERVTILEAIGLAGDLNITAKRTDVLFVREVNGERNYSHLDLTSGELFKSSNYYIKNNDLIYVPPTKTKYTQVNHSFEIASLILSALSIIAIVYSTTHK